MHASAAARPSAPRLVLGIESSCDDTGVAVVASDGRVLSSELVSQAAIHAQWGGVVPSLARDAHERAVDGCVERALRGAGLGDGAALDAVAVTVGPGLSLCLAVGVRAARGLAARLGKPLLAVHHMEAHALVARMGAGPREGAGVCSSEAPGDPLLIAPPSVADNPSSSSTTPPSVPFPFLCALVSGGHNLLLIAHGVGEYTLLGTTLDDALGEAYDKAARLLGLDPVPSGGAAVERAAARGDARAHAFPVPLARQANCNFSYAGLKTSLRVAVERERRRLLVEAREGAGPESREASDGAALDPGALPPLPAATVDDLAASFQRAAVRHLATRVRRAAAWAAESAPAVRHLVLAGGVARNETVRRELAAAAAEAGLAFVVPPPALCTDNGAMVAWAALESIAAGKADLRDPGLAVRARELDDGWVDVRARWPLTARRHPRMQAEAPRSAKKKRIFPPLFQESSAGGQ